MNAPIFSKPVFVMPFRLLFLAAGLLALLSMAYWGLFWQSPWPFEAYAGPLFWHAHEMVFGFSGAVLVGFLMTAVKNWTGLPTLRGPLLVLTMACWLTLRMGLTAENADPFALAILAAIYWFIPTVYFCFMVAKAGLWRNLILAFVMTGMGVLDGLSILQADELQVALHYIYGGVFVMLLAVTIISGRVFPFFTARATNTPKVENHPVIELAAVMLHLFWLVWIILHGLHDREFTVAVLATLTASVHTLRFLRWNFVLSLSNPMLWSLYGGYLFLIFGFAALAFYHLGIIDNVSAALHLLTVGVIAGLIYSMTTRVSLGHTGRVIVASKNVVTGFYIMLVAAVARGLLPLILPASWTVLCYWLSAFLWCVAFAIWLWEFLPILITPRVDGKSG